VLDPVATGVLLLGAVASSSRFLRSLSLALMVGVSAAPALGQSAADKSTARRLATEGIELHGQGKYAEALDRLQRAQSLYDAPVHLLYIARVQAKLNQVVEASETYRRLVRVELAPNAPAAFRDAVDAGKREVSEVEARIAWLRVEIDPANVTGLELTIDGQEVSAAVVGVERPANPGRHTVRATAPGYGTAEASVDLAEAEKKSVDLRLTRDPKATATPGPAAAPPAPAVTRGSAGVAADAGSTSTESSKDDWKALHLFGGLRLGAAFPGGSLYQVDGAEMATSEYFKTGVGGELHAGAWFARYFGAKVFVEAYSFAPGRGLDRLAELDSGGRVENMTSAQGFGLALMAGTPLRQWGAFGELGITFSQQFSVTRTFEAEDSPCGANFEQTLSFSGAAFRLGAGARIPVSRIFQLTPYFLASLGQAKKVENESSCTLLTDAESTWPASGDFAEAVGNRLLIVGIGGDLTFGLR
jgi:hypothetical protein